MPRRVFSMTYFCSAFVSSASWRGVQVLLAVLVLRRARDLTQAVREQRLRLVVREGGAQLIVDHHAALREPVGGELRDLLFQRHARQEIGDAFVRRQLRVEVLRLRESGVAGGGGGGGTGRQTDGDQQGQGVRSFHAGGAYAQPRPRGQPTAAGLLTISYLLAQRQGHEDRIVREGAGRRSADTRGRKYVDRDRDAGRRRGVDDRVRHARIS